MKPPIGFDIIWKGSGKYTVMSHDPRIIRAKDGTLYNLDKMGYPDWDTLLGGYVHIVDDFIAFVVKTLDKQ